MTTTLELIRGSTTLDISDEINYQHEQNDGFGMPPLHRITERGPLQDGVTDRGYRLDPRPIALVIPMLTDTWSDHYDRREALLDVLNPGYDEIIQLRFTLPDGSQRQIDTHLAAGPVFTTKDQIAGGSNMRAGFTLVAPDPSWYDLTPGSATFALGGGADTWPVPFSVPFTVGASTIDITTVIDYQGSYISYPHLIRITGPITDAIITNNATGEKLDFTGTTIAGGDYYDIDCRYGYKTVVDAAGANKISKLTTDSDLVTFHLAIKQSNSIRVQGSSITASTVVQISYVTRYLGV